jgi:hypothetical protein
MRFNHVLIVTVLICQFHLASCAAGHVYGSAEIETRLESFVGRKYDPSIGWGDGWNKINDENKNFELEFIQKSGCSYAIKIRKDTSTVDSWRFTSPKDKCEDNYSPGA